MPTIVVTTSVFERWNRLKTRLNFFDDTDLTLFLIQFWESKNYICQDEVKMGNPYVDDMTVRVKSDVMVQETNNDETNRTATVLEGSDKESTTASSKQTVNVQYKTDLDDDNFYIDKNLRTMVVLPEIPLNPRTSAERLSPCTVTQLRDEHGSQVFPLNEHFTKPQVLFFIELIRPYLLEDGELPNSITALENKMKFGRGQKGLLWNELAAKMTKEYSETFTKEKVCRKWQTLVDGYKKAKENSTTGKRACRFQFYAEMEELVGDGQGDGQATDVSICQTQREHIVSRSDPCVSQESLSFAPSSIVSPPIAPSPIASTSTTDNKRRIEDSEESDLLKYLKKSDARAEERQQHILNDMQKTQESFLVLFGKLIEKLPDKK
ncbi:uncharacterized protein LOC126807767 [Patella vulgata]|uniref:uncharacterized protein LOC126807767 n=1 Tax=Patella vulgata TaxID=6465 RepID=UPI0024A86DC2|nr:uncharacterized protein LOC126807767 [Patella vulgata]XP_055959385.1 uncharacterized protein LOC126807767 [Patella vulgata]XP_055959386.1 uncharacterized protein LOC126807767 [Patella vulgata]XP_055959387.1 uncharacterized protein LOC126807767 [Patella vulgata]XP_055959388.1 uncharacterized protein LOC126807767 [Patella vulgata]